jgi:hypothetical protein
MDPIASDHQRTAVVDAQRAVLRVDAEQLPIRSAVPVCLGAEPIAEVEGRFPHPRPLRRCEVAAGRGALGDALDLVAPGGDGRRQVCGDGVVSHAAALTIRMPDATSPHAPRSEQSKCRSPGVITAGASPLAQEFLIVVPSTLLRLVELPLNGGT